MPVRFLKHCTVAAVFLMLATDAFAQASGAQTFRIFLRGGEIGLEEVTLLDSPTGWTLRGSSRLRAPLNLSIDYWEARYDRAWKPLELTVNLTEKESQWTVHTMFSGTSASSDIEQGGQTQRRSSTVAGDTVVLPNLVFGAYEALAARLATAQPGTQLQGFIAPQDPVSMMVSAVTDETIQVPGRSIAARRWQLHVGAATSPLEMEIWTDGSRLLRIDIPVQMVSVLRDDIAAVSARLVTMGRGNDEQAAIPSNGFSLASTISRPAASTDPKQPPARLPAVVLLSGSDPSDREEIVAGIPIFAQLATSLADAGFLVVRYDERGTGQSGGRPESASYEEFANDARAVVTYLSRRKDVDPKRISVIGYGEGGWISLLLAAREERVGAVALIGTPSIPGTELVVEQQKRMFERNGTPAASQQTAIDQQKAILDAVVSGKGWEALPPDVRRRVDTPLYRSFLTFDPSKAMVRVRQPMLILQPALDREVPAYHGEQLTQLARSRQKARGTDFVSLPSLNHLLVKSTTGEVAEYGSLPERSVSADAIVAISSWLEKALPAAPSK